MSVFADTTPIVAYTPHNALDDGTYVRLLYFEAKPGRPAAHFVLSRSVVSEVFKDCGFGKPHTDGRTWVQVLTPRAFDLWAMVQECVKAVQRGGPVKDSEKYPITVELPSGEQSEDYYLSVMASARPGEEHELFFLLFAGQDD